MPSLRSVSAVASAAVAAAALAACATATAPDEEGRRPAADGGTPGARPDAGDIRPDPADAGVPVGADAGADPRPDGAPSGCQPGQALANGDFDLGPGGGWVESSGAAANYPLVVAADELPVDGDGQPVVVPHSGGHAVWLGGYLAELLVAHDVLGQSVTVPAGATGLAVTGQRILATEEDPLFGAWDYVDVQIVDAGGAVLETVTTWSNLDATLAWQPFTVPVSGDYAGQTIRLQLVSSIDDLHNTNFFFDSLALTVSCP